MLDGPRRYLGPFDAPDTQERYDRLIAEWLAGGRQVRGDPEDLAVVELVARLLAHAEHYYRKLNGETASELELFALAWTPSNRKSLDVKVHGINAGDKSSVITSVKPVAFCI